MIHAVLDTDHDSKAIQGSLERMKTRVDDFNHQAKTCHMRLTESIILRQSVGHQELKHRVNSVQGATKLLLSSVERLRATIERMEAERRTETMRKIAVRKAMARNTLTVKELISIPGYRGTMAKEDCAQVLSSSRRMPLKEQNRASALMRDSRVMDWIARPVSSMLLINGRSTAQKRSPVSFLCSTLVNALEDACEAGGDGYENGRLFVLSFFCGEHNILGEDDIGHPLGMIRSLLGQLLKMYPEFEVDETIRNRWKRAQERDFTRLRSVCKLFEALIWALGPDARVHVIVDAVHYYEDKRRRENLDIVTRTLRSCMSTSSGPVVKVLYSSPASCSYIQKEFDEDEILNMRRFCPNQGSVNTARWKRDVVVKVDALSCRDEDNYGWSEHGKDLDSNVEGKCSDEDSDKNGDEA